MLAADIAEDLKEGVLDSINEPDSGYYHNPLSRGDTDGDGDSSIFDILNLTRGLSSALDSTGKLSLTAPEFMASLGMEDNFFPDVSNDGKVDTVDVLKAIRDKSEDLALREARAEGDHGDLHALVEYRIFDANPLDGNATELDSIPLNQAVFLAIVVNDVSNSGTEGIGVAYLDVMLDTDHNATFVGTGDALKDVQVNDVFDEFQRGSFVGGSVNGNLFTDPSLIDEVGGVDILPFEGNELNGPSSILAVTQMTLQSADLTPTDDEFAVIQDSGENRLEVTLNDKDGTFDVAGNPADTDGFDFATELPTRELEVDEIDFGARSIPIDAFPEITAINGTPVGGTISTSLGSVRLDNGGTPNDFSDDALIYTPGAGQVGTDIFTYEMECDGQTGTATVTVEIGELNDPPSIDAPDTLSTNEETAIGITASVSDPDAGNGDLTLSITAQNGSVNVTSVTGTLTEINTALVGLTYTPNDLFSGEADVVFTVNDNGNTGVGGEQTATHTTVITVNAVNDPPVISGDATQETEEGLLLNMSYSVADPDIGSGDMLVVVSVPSGKGTLAVSSTTGLTFIDNQGDERMEFTGTLTAVNSALAGLSYTPGAGVENEVVNMTITVDDQGNTPPPAEDDELIVAITVVPSERPAARNDDLDTVENSLDTNPNNRVDVLDNDIPSEFNGVEGVLELISFTQPANGEVTRDGDILVYEPDPGFYGSDPFTYVVNDSNDPNNDGDSTGTVNVEVAPVNDPPTLNITPDSLTLNEDDSITFSVAVDDPIDAAFFDGDGPDTYEVTLTATGGTMTANAGASVVGNGSSNVVLTGTLAELNASLTDATYQGDAFVFGDFSLTAEIDDNGNVGGNSMTADETIDITINPINNAPVVSVPDLQLGVKNVAFVFDSSA